MMMAGLAPIDTSDKVFSITPSSMSAGSVTTISGFTLGADAYEVKTTSVWGSTAKVFGWTGNYLGGPTVTEALFETKARGRDVVVTTWSRIGALYLRCDRTTGRAIRVSWTGQASNGELYVTYCTNVPDTFAEFVPGYDIGGLALFGTNNLASYVTGWDTSATDGDEFEISLIANVLTVKWNSQTIYTTDICFFHMKHGTVLYASTLTEGAVRDTEITFKASEPTYTDGDNLVLDFRDWGFKELSTTGSMSAGSTTLTVASATGFAIGDRIVVEIGGETGAGLRNTVGVGGTWPRDRYANVASLPDPATYYAANGSNDAYAWVEDVGKVYIDTGFSWAEWTDYALADPARARAYYYSTQMWPQALLATITNISGNTITLDTASAVATTNATVYYDNSWIWDYLMPNSRFAWAGDNYISNDAWEVRFPAGSFCYHTGNRSPWGYNWTFRGAGRASTEFHAPKGTKSPVFIFNGEYMTVSDMKFMAWVGNNYTGLDASPLYPVAALQNAVQTGGTYKSGGLFERLDFENTWGGIILDTRFGALARNCAATMTNGNLQQYITWFFQMGYCDANTWMEDITYTATEVGSAFEIFQVDGGGFRRCTATQGVVASNSSGGGWLMEDMVVSVDWNNIPEFDWHDASGPGINVNTNIGDGAQNPGIIVEGGTIRNPTITIVKDGTGRMASGININGGAVNITVEGTHPAKPGQGVITMSDYQVGDAGRGAAGILSDPSGTVIRGMRVIGASDAGGGEFSNISIRSSDGVIEDCVAETMAIQNSGGTHVSQQGLNGNITNAEYEAL